MLPVLTFVVALNVPVDKPVNTKLVAVALVNCKLVALTFVVITFVLVKLVAVKAPSVADVATSVDVVMSVALNVVMVLCVNLALAELNCEVTFKVPAVIPVFKFKLLVVKKNLKKTRYKYLHGKSSWHHLNFRVNTCDFKKE